jgi:hypothetical protein
VAVFDVVTLRADVFLAVVLVAVLATGAILLMPYQCFRYLVDKGARSINIHCGMGS